MTFVSVFIGGGIGALIRFLISNFMSVPYGTFLVNIIGSFIIGFAYMFFVDKADLNPVLKFALTAGFCGGLTTFSTFSLEIFTMLEGHQFIQAFGYMILSVIICVIAVSIGAYCAKVF